MSQSIETADGIVADAVDLFSSFKSICFEFESSVDITVQSISKEVVVAPFEFVVDSPGDLVDVDLMSAIDERESTTSLPFSCNRRNDANREFNSTPDCECKLKKHLHVNIVKHC